MGWKRGHTRGNSTSKILKQEGSLDSEGSRKDWETGEQCVMRLNRLVRASHRKDESFFLGVISSHWRIFKEAVAWSDANFNAVGWNSDPLNPLALLILSLAGGLLFNNNRSKVCHGRQSLVATEQFVGLLESLWEEPGERNLLIFIKRWRPYKDAMGKGRIMAYHKRLPPDNSRWTQHSLSNNNNKWHLSPIICQSRWSTFACLKSLIF